MVLIDMGSECDCTWTRRLFDAGIDAVGRFEVGQLSQHSFNGQLFILIRRRVCEVLG